MPDGVDARELDPEVRRDLRSLAKDTAELTAQHLIMTGRLIDSDPEQALAHARAATALAGRVGPVREAAGLAAYAAGEWTLALSELRTARRVTGSPEHLAVLADCERALGRPERALAMLDDPDVGRLDQAARVELVIVVAGARRDLGEVDAAVLLLQTPAQGSKARHPWAARLWYAYADALDAAGRPEARDWFERAAEIDEGETAALDRLLELDGVVFAEPVDDAPDLETTHPEDQADVVRAGSGPGRRSEQREDGVPSMTLEELGLAPVTAADAPDHAVEPAQGSDPVADAPHDDARDDNPEQPRSDGDATPSTAPTAPAVPPPGFIAPPAPAEDSPAEQVGDATPVAGRNAQPGRAVVAPAFSHEAPPVVAAPADDVPLGQQELFSDLGGDSTQP